MSNAHYGLCSKAGCLTIALLSYSLFPLKIGHESQTLIYQQKDVEISHPVDTDIESNEWMEIFRRNSPFPYCVRKWVNMTDWVKLHNFCMSTSRISRIFHDQWAVNHLNLMVLKPCHPEDWPFPNYGEFYSSFFPLSVIFTWSIFPVNRRLLTLCVKLLCSRLVRERNLFCCGVWVLLLFRVLALLMIVLEQ